MNIAIEFKHKIMLDNTILKKMGMASDAYERQNRDTRFWLEDLTERERLENLEVGGRIILKQFFKKGAGPWTELI